MASSLFSSSWYKVANLHPKLRDHISIHRHHYRGELWYVLQDNSSAKNHRFSPQVYYILTLMDGHRSVENIWNRSLDYFGDESPDQDELIKLLGQLHGNDLLLCDITPDALEIFQRYERKQKNKLKQKLLTPLAIRIPLWDPDAFLERWLSLVSPLFGWFGKLIWLSVVGFALLMAVSHWSDLTEDLSVRVMSPGNLVILFLIYPVIKLFHELGHAFATKKWGGEVHEMGVMFLVFIPVPYVDASSSWSFRDKKKRLVVSAAGMGVELFIAAIALFFWLNIEAGIVSLFCYNIMLIGGVSTLFFNANPLLRFDGYYILADLVEVPNLASRSNNYIGYLFQRYLFGVTNAQSPATVPSEKGWFVFYSLAAFCYRMFISFIIIIFVAGQFFIIGILLAIWAFITMLGVPIFKQFKFLFTSPLIQRKRFRAIVSSSVIILLLSGLLAFLPMPLSTYTQGILWIPEQAQIKVESEGFVKTISVQDNKLINKGDVILVLDNEQFLSELKILRYTQQELQAKYKEVQFTDQVQAQIIAQQFKSNTQVEEKLQKRIDDLIIRSPAFGRLILPQVDNLSGRFLKKGALIAYVFDYPLNTVRTVITQDDIGLVRENTLSVEVRLADNLSQRFPVQVVRKIPAATQHLPSAALGFSGGGVIPVSPTDISGETAYEKIFQIDLKLPERVHASFPGERVYVRFDHGKEALIWQWYRSLRQLFLRQFSV